VNFFKKKEDQTDHKCLLALRFFSTFSNIFVPQGCLLAPLPLTRMTAIVKMEKNRPSFQSKLDRREGNSRICGFICGFALLFFCYF
jgi:hypothetical protein